MKPIGSIMSINDESTVANSTESEDKVEVSTVEDILKAHIANHTIHLNKDKIAEWDAKETPKGAKAKADYVMATLKEHTSDRSVHLTKEEKTKLQDKYTRNEVDNKIAAAAMGIIWKPPVETSSEFREKYQGIVGAKEGWFVPVNKESIGYRYTGGKWHKVSMFRSPLATEDNDGLMSVIQLKKLDGIAEGANRYVHPNESNTRHVTDDQIATWDSKADNNIVSYHKAGLMTPDMLMKLESIQYDGKSHIIKDVKVPIVKTEINTVTVGPVNSGAEIEVNEDSSLHRTFETILNNFIVRKIILLEGKYFTRKPILINKDNIEIVSNSAIISNGINDPEGKNDDYIFIIKANNVKVSGITLECFAITADINTKYGCIKSTGLYNTFNNLTLKGRDGIVVVGSNNVIERCTFRNNFTAIHVSSSPSLACQNNKIQDNDILDARCGITLGSSYSACQYNTIKDNLVINAKTGINIGNISLGSDVVPIYNKILDNAVCRETCKDGEYTIVVGGQKNIIGGNLLKGKGIMLISDDNKVYQNYEV